MLPEKRFVDESEFNETMMNDLLNKVKSFLFDKDTKIKALIVKGIEHNNKEFTFNIGNANLLFNLLVLDISEKLSFTFKHINEVKIHGDVYFFFKDLIKSYKETN